MSGEIYICDVTVDVGTHVRGKRYQFDKYSVKNIPLILIDGKIASERQLGILRKYIANENNIVGDITTKLFNNIRITRAEFSSKTQYEFNPEIH